LNRENLTIVDAEQTKRKMQQVHIYKMNLKHNQFSLITDSVRGDKSVVTDCKAAQVLTLHVCSPSTGHTTKDITPSGPTKG
jgi:hypothetical protein